MTMIRVLVASAALGGLMTVGAPAVADAQHVPGLPRAVGRVVSLQPGSIHGVVSDEVGTPVTGVMISAYGVTTAFAFTDRRGRFQFDALPPGPYLVRAYFKGFQAPAPTIVEVRPNGRALSSIALRKTDGTPPVLAAGVSGGALPDFGEQAVVENAPREGEESTHIEEHETLWRLRHTRRGVLKSATMLGDLLDYRELGGADLFGSADALGRAVAVPARIATNFFIETPFSGQVNLLTTGYFERPEQLLAVPGFAPGSAGIAHLSVGAPVGNHADWTVNGAVSQADLSAWIVAGSYVTRSPASHRLDVGMSYAAQRYSGGNPLALRGVADVTRNASSVHGFDTFALTPSVSVTYGARYARYDYLRHRALVSPRIEVLLVPLDGLRLGVSLSRTAHAPGAEEFLPPDDTGIWLPPQRTFSSLKSSRELDAERLTHVAVNIEQDIAGATLAVRGFRQHVDGQLFTLFGADSPDQPVASVGHYFVGSAGNVEATGGAAELRGRWTGRIQGAVSYRLTRTRLDPTTDLRYVLLLARAPEMDTVDRIHDVATTIAADVPETSTRVLLVYRASNAFAEGGARAAAETDGSGTGIRYRFDVQVRQSLPFMSFGNAKWEALFAIRNFFRETGVDESVYGELLVVRPPKRIVGGVSLHF
jgi:hypothetical protein